MDGHCYQCAEKFGFFRKEHGCKRCGHSFCKTCLPYTAVIPSSGAKEQSVCKECYTFLKASPEEQKQNKVNEGKYSPPENYKKRVAAYNAKQEAREGKGKTTTSPSSISSGTSSKNKYKGLSAADRNLAERLDRLKEERRKMRGRVASVEEMEDRLRQLKGLPSTSSTTLQNQTVYKPPDTRTSQEQFDDLMGEMKDEAALDARIAGRDLEEESKDIEVPSESDLKNMEDEAKKLIQDAKDNIQKEKEGSERDEEMAARVAKLKGVNPTSDSGETSGGDKEISEEEATKRLIAQIQEEDKMEQKIKEDGFGDVLSQRKPTSDVKRAERKQSVDPDELPWCSICNEDATLRCHGCDDDLYCARCFREGHDQFDLPDHKTVPYRPPRKDGR